MKDKNQKILDAYMMSDFSLFGMLVKDTTPEVINNCDTSGRSSNNGYGTMNTLLESILRYHRHNVSPNMEAVKIIVNAGGITKPTPQKISYAANNANMCRLPLFEALVKDATPEVIVEASKMYKKPWVLEENYQLLSEEMKKHYDNETQNATKVDKIFTQAKEEVSAKLLDVTASASDPISVVDKVDDTVDDNTLLDSSLVGSESACAAAVSDFS